MASPEDRSAEIQKARNKIRRRYKTNTKKRTRFMPQEIPGIKFQIVVYKLAGFTNKQIASAVGCSKGQVKEFLAEGDVVEMLSILRESMADSALDLLETYTLEAVTAIVAVMRTSDDDKYILQAAADILDRAGIPKASKQERHQVNEERFTLEDDGLVDRIRTLPPERQEEAAQMIEQFEQFLLEHAAGEGNEESAETDN